MTMTGQAKIVFLVDRLLDDLRMLPRARKLLERITANAEAFGAFGDKSFMGSFSGAWRPLIEAAIAFCERLAVRHNGIVLEVDFAGLDLRDVVFDDDHIAKLKLFAGDPQYAAVAPEALDIVRQCRHIQVLLHVDDMRVAA
jgi:hypothetical protein